MTSTIKPIVPTADGFDQSVHDLRSLALRSLARMYRPGEGTYCFRLRRQDGRDVLEGVSGRYKAIALMGLATESPRTARNVLADQDPKDICEHLVDESQNVEDIGQVALSLWAARAWKTSKVHDALDALKRMNPIRRPCPTVELSWCLSALCFGENGLMDEDLGRILAERLLDSFHHESALFSHWPTDVMKSSFRSHVACFADIVYPIQALSYYFRATGCRAALQAARACANRMCLSQGPAGQWWWHHDIRTGAVVERYPVYSVHQDGMAPMALRALREAGGDDHTDAVRKGLDWLRHAPEIDGSLIDRQADVIWRKVARNEPNKLSRGLQAYASRLHPSFRLPLGRIFPPRTIDFETRPYHMGWILHAFRGNAL